MGNTRLVNAKRVLKIAREEYESKPQDFSLELQMVNFYMQLSQAKGITNHDEMREQALLHMRNYIYQ